MYVDRITTAPLPDGLAGTKQTLREMAAIVRRDAGNLWVRQRALDIVKNCGGHNFDCEIRALFNFCRDEIVYRRDPVDVEWVQDATRTIGVFGSGDCDDKVVCLATLLATLGHRSRFVVIGSSPTKHTHVFLEVHTAHGWLSLDPTPEQAPAGWQARALERSVYDIWRSDQSSGFLGVMLAAGLIYWLAK